MNLQKNKKVLMIGLDSADARYLQAYLPKLPNLQGLFSAGRFLSLNSTAAAMDASVWPTFYQGKLPGEHGAYFPFQWDCEGMCYRRLNDLDWLKFEPFWHRLGAEGIPVGLLDVMMIPVPPKPAKNVSYYHWQTQDEGNPDQYNYTSIWPEARRLFGRNELGYDISADMNAGQKTVLYKKLLTSTRTRGQLTRWLLDNTNWGLFVAAFSEIHRSGHYFCPNPQQAGKKPDEDLLLGLYQETDRALGHVLSGIDREKTHVVVFSPSGMGPNNSQSHFLSEVLFRFNQQYSGKKTAPRLTRSKPGMIRQLRDKLPGPIQVEIAKRVNQPVRDWVVNRAYTGGLDWNSTLAFHVLSGGQGYIRWNIAGRERYGILREDDPKIETYSKALSEELLSLTAVCNGRKIVKKLIDIPTAYPGPYCRHLPDISVIWEDMEPVTEIFSPTLGTFKARIGTGRGGNHRDTAFALTSAPELPGLDDPTHIVELGRYVEGLFNSLKI